MKCKYCGDIVVRMPSHQRVCTQYRIWFDNTVTKQFLEDQYVIQGKSCNQIAQELGLASSTSINRAITRCGIDKRNISQSKLQPKCKERVEKTNIDRYGERHNFCKHHISRVLWQQRLFDTEGITNVFQREEVKHKIANRIRIACSGRISKIHKRVYDRLVQDGIECQNEFNIPNTRYWYDIHISQTCKIIEINGDLYHANPNIYYAQDIVCGPAHFQPQAAQHIWDKDARKQNCAVVNGYQLLIVWESDIRRNFDNVIKTIKTFIEDKVDESSKIKTCVKNRSSI